MVKNIIKITIFLAINLLVFYSCTPDMTEVIDEGTTPQTSGAVLTLADLDTFFVVDTSSVFYITSYFTYDSIIVPDSTKIRFTATGTGSITSFAYTENGSAVAEYNPFVSGEVLSGKRTITVSSAINGYPAMDEKVVYVQNMLDEDPVLKVSLWSMVKDTFFVADTSIRMDVHTLANIGSLPIEDSVNVKFYASFGSITENSLTSNGEADAVFSPITAAGLILDGELKLKAKISEYDQTVWDSISIYVKNLVDIIPDTSYTLNIWSMNTDTFYVSDSADVLNIYANVKNDTLNAPDSTVVNFLVDNGLIGEQAETVAGLAKVVYSPQTTSGEIYDGNVTVLSSVAVSQHSSYDTLNFYVKNIIDTGQIVPQDTTYTLNLWTMQKDTFFINDSLDVLNIYADVRKDTVSAEDSLKIRFYSSFGSISETTEVIDGQAKAVYTPKSPSGTYLSGDLFIKAAVANDTLVYDSLLIHVKNQLDLK